ncbi:PREDICTED: uncharacterized protein LOC105515191 [Colobus angolensis palliatus]|uniref:uncharacterized protein LOC105515191 n=1 Tax=Colobus angolensis palliatus TaxID=336983 RepID=UPI0005F37C97|nr:PREDICTED: uncharacterized protein LOC105515191 [Colobus angolensis palliatus]
MGRRWGKGKRARSKDPEPAGAALPGPRRQHLPTRARPRATRPRRPPPLSVRGRLGARQADTPLRSSQAAAAARSGLRDSGAAASGRLAARITRGSGCLLAGAARRALGARVRRRRRTGGRTWAARSLAAGSAGTGRAGRVALTMVFCWDTGVLLCALLGCLLLTGSSSGSKLKGPELSLKGTQHVMQAGQTLHLQCRGEAAHQWSLPETVTKESERLSITESACGRNGKQFCSTLTLNAAQANHTGFYSCKYLAVPTSKKETESAIYIFISGKTSIFYILFAVALQ